MSIKVLIINVNLIMKWIISGADGRRKKVLQLGYSKNYQFFGFCDKNRLTVFQKVIITINIFWTR